MAQRYIKAVLDKYTCEPCRVWHAVSAHAGRKPPHTLCTNPQGCRCLAVDESHFQRVTPTVVPLFEQADAVQRMRNTQYVDDGDAVLSHQPIADIWGALLGHPVPVRMVPLLLAALKLARIARNPLHNDSYVDAANYIRLAHDARDHGHNASSSGAP